MTDAELTQGLRQRDPTALAALVDTYGPAAYALIRRILAGLGSAEDVEECASDAFLAAWNKIEQFDSGRAPLRTWLLILAKYQALERRRALAHPPHDPLASDDVWDPTPGPDESLASAEERREVHAALAALAPLDRKLVYSRYFLGERVDQAARALGLSRQAADNRLWRARQLLRKHLWQEEVAGGDA